MEFDLYPVIKGHGLSLNPFGAIALANPAAFRIADRFRLAVVFQITVIRRSAKSPAYPALFFLSGQPLISAVYD